MDNISKNSIQQKSTSETIMDKMKRDGKRFWAGDNISEYVSS